MSSDNNVKDTQNEEALNEAIIKFKKRKKLRIQREIKPFFSSNLQELIDERKQEIKQKNKEILNKAKQQQSARQLIEDFWENDNYKDKNYQEKFSKIFTGFDDKFWKTINDMTTKKGDANTKNNVKTKNNNKAQKDTTKTNTKSKLTQSIIMW